MGGAVSMFRSKPGAPAASSSASAAAHTQSNIVENPYQRQQMSSQNSSPNPASNSPPHGLTLQSVEQDAAFSTSHPSTSSSPRVTIDMSSNVPYTPHGPEADIFKYYCPLCMVYYKNILKVQCCGNYICFSCTKDYISTKGMDHVKYLEDLEVNRILLAEIMCPNCFNRGFIPSHVGCHEIVRDYSTRDQPGVPKFNQPSPVRIGESFEDLKRKMIPFKALSQTNNNSEDPAPGKPATETITNNNHPRVNGIAMIDNSPITSQDRQLQNNSNHNNNHDEEHDEHSRLAATYSHQTPRHPESTPRQQRYVLSVSRTNPRDQEHHEDDDDANIVRRLPINSSRRGSRDHQQHPEDENLFRLITNNITYSAAPTPSANKYEHREDRVHEDSKIDEDLIYSEQDHRMSEDHIIPDHLSETADMEDSLEGSEILLGKINFTEQSYPHLVAHEKVASDFMHEVMGIAMERRQHVQ